MIFRRLKILLFAFAALVIFSYSCNLANSPGAYELITTTTPENGGTIEPSSGKFKEGSSIEITAIPANGYRFVEWSGDLSGTENPASLKFDSDKKVTAVFEANIQYALNITVEGEGTVREEVVPAKADYEEGTVVQLTAEAAEGWMFAGWEGDLEGNENPALVTMDSEKNITAVFSPSVISLNITVEGEGTVQEEILQSPEDESEVLAETMGLKKELKTTIKAPKAAKHAAGNSIEAALTDYEFGTLVQLTAQPSENWAFLRWEGDLESTENPASITMDESKDVTAVFMEVDEDAEIIVSTNNIINITQSSALSGGTISVTGDVTVSQRGVCWDINPSPDVNNDCTDNGTGLSDFTSTITGLTASTTYYVRAYAISSEGTVYGNEESFTTLAETPDFYTISISTTGEGSVSQNPDQEQYEDGENVVLTATPEQGWQFSRWEGDLQGSQNPVTITMDENKTITAVFEEQIVENEVTVTTHAASSITFNSAVSGGNINAEEGVSINQRGVCWAVDENPNVGDSCTDDGTGPGTFTSNLSDLSPVTTYFVRAYAITEEEIYYGDQQSFTTAEEPERFTVTVQAEGEGEVSVDPNQTEYEEGTEVTLTATAEEGWIFANWEGDLEGTENPAILTITEDLEITAVFEAEANEFTVNVTTSGEGTVSLEPDQTTYTEGEAVVLTANPAEGWEFTGWSGDIESADNPVEITVTENMSITAAFEETASEVNLDVTTDGNGTVELDPPGGTYTAGQQVNLSAIANEDFQFSSWSGDIASTENPITVTVNENMQVMANFEAVEESGTSMSVSHGFNPNVTPDNISPSEAQRTYPVIQADWPGPGGDKRWLGRNLGAVESPSTYEYEGPSSSGWYFQFNLEQGQYFSGDPLWDGGFISPGGSFIISSFQYPDWEIEHDPCRILLGGTWRIPTYEEWESFHNALASSGGLEAGTAQDAFDSALNLNINGSLDFHNGGSHSPGRGMYYSRTTYVDETGNDPGTSARILSFSESGSSLDFRVGKNIAMSIRCIEA